MAGTSPTKIEVTFDTDAVCNLKISSCKGAEKKAAIVMEKGFLLSNQEIQRMLVQAEKHDREDQNAD